jgi:release factor glutamine methyltransferase
LSFIIALLHNISGIMTRKEWKILASKRLVGTEASVLTAELLLCHILGISRVSLITHDTEVLSEREYHALENLLKRRLTGEPVAYLLGEREFYGRDFAVNCHTLIPRPETEHIVEEALAFFSESSSLYFCDFGTGSGCIAVTLAAERPLWHGVAVDISSQALTVARDNAFRHGVGERLELRLADFTRPFGDGQDKFDLIVSNPPYISEEEYAGLSSGVRNFEPRSALVPGPSGMEHPKAVELQARMLLKSGGLFLMEHGWLQGKLCRELCSDEYWMNVHTVRDLAGRDRILFAVRRES